MQEALLRFLPVKRNICAIKKRKANVVRPKSGHIRARFLHESVDRDIFVINFRPDCKFRVVKRRHKHKPKLPPSPAKRDRKDNGRRKNADKFVRIAHKSSHARKPKTQQICPKVSVNNKAADRNNKSKNRR